VSIQDLMEYDASACIGDATLEIYGQPCTLFAPKSQKMLGYENLGKELETWTGVQDIASSYTPFSAKVWVEFNPQRSVFWHFNLNPDDPDNKELLTAILPFNSTVREGWLLATALNGKLSVWGKMFFSVAKIKEEGKFQTLRRTYFLRPLATQELVDLLDKYVSEVH